MFGVMLFSLLHGHHGWIGGGVARLRASGVRRIGAGVLVAAVRNSAVHGASGHRHGDPLHLRPADAHRSAGIGSFRRMSGQNPFQVSLASLDDLNSSPEGSPLVETYEIRIPNSNLADSCRFLVEWLGLNGEVSCKEFSNHYLASMI